MVGIYNAPNNDKYATVLKVFLNEENTSDVSGSIEVNSVEISETKHGDRANNSGYVRPIVVLKSTLKITGGNGTSNSSYILGV